MTVRDQLTFRASVLFAIAALLVLPNAPAAYAQPYESSEVWCKAYNSDATAIRRCIETEKRLRQEEELDEALKNTFPASDPVSIEQPLKQTIR